MDVIYVKSSWFRFKIFIKDWKKKYIDSWISISPAYGGSPKALKFLATGDPDDIPFLKSLKIREVYRTWDTVFWLFPNK